MIYAWVLLVVGYFCAAAATAYLIGLLHDTRDLTEARIGVAIWSLVWPLVWPCVALYYAVCAGSRRRGGRWQR